MSETFYIFTLNDCHHCHSLKKRLNSLSIPFIDVDVDSNEKLWDKIVEQTGNQYVPTVYVKTEGDDLGEVLSPSIDFENEDELINILEKRIKSQGN